jgi:HD-GYP domain-containing protein (c-di-GMP phosphodiesterase class II)
MERDTEIPEDIEKLMKKYKPKGRLEYTTRFILELLGRNHLKVKIHSENVARLAVLVGEGMKKDIKAALYSALIHDVGKIFLPADLFSGRKILPEEYAEVKKHVLMAFRVIVDEHMFVALCAALHHAMYDEGYGITIDDFPKNLQLKTIKKILEIATIISICDFIEAFTHRPSEVGIDLREVLEKKYSDDKLVVEEALKGAGILGWM